MKKRGRSFQKRMQQVIRRATPPKSISVSTMEITVRKRQVNATNGTIKSLSTAMQDNVKRPRLSTAAAAAIDITQFGNNALRFSKQSETSSQQNHADEKSNKEESEEEETFQLLTSMQEEKNIVNNVESLTSKLDCWSLTNLKEWRRQQLALSRHSEKTMKNTCKLPTMKERQKDAKQEMMRLMTMERGNQVLDDD